MSEALEIIEIDDAADPRLTAYRAIRERDLLGRDHCFILEGRVVVLHALEFGHFPVESVLMASRFRANFAAEAVLAYQRRRASGAPFPALYAASDAVVESLTGFAVHRGILAAGRCNGAPGLAEFIAGLPDEALIVVMLAVANHDNVGAVFRNAAAFGASGIILDSGACSPLYRKAMRVSVGACASLPFVHGGTEGAIVQALRVAGFSVFALSPDAKRSLYEVGTLAPMPARCALILGSEGHGLSRDIRGQILRGEIEGLYIPATSRIDSLNVAAASAVALSWLYERRTHGTK